ncbi:hypothetical protein H7J86_26385 [Mycobacterium hackensackense]|uniref:glycine-rich domain-containing protein n=1 Tax=Mycobacterium hackensackense TaxID=228909 RepID=UPI002265D110|nr:hypothetical protein [Mycobacterium hackensackense]MCV7255698.1 hypothetical protein [Mycobacterium hackensackense]
MPRAVDKHPQKRGTGNAIFNPLRSGVASYEDPMSAIGSDMREIGGPWRTVYSSIGKLFGLPSPEEIVAGVANGIGTVIAGAVDFLGSLGEHFVDLVDGFANIFKIPILDPSKILNLPGLFSNVTAGFKSFFDTWFGRTDGDGSTTQLTYTIEAIKDAVINGYTVHTITSSETNWAVPIPVPTEFTAILIGGGHDGGAGGSGDPGLHGSYIALPVDLTGVTALDIQVGAPGNKSYVRVANTTTPHTGTVLAESAAPGAPGGIAGPFGLTASASTPGSGGQGAVGSTNSTPGEASALGVGGTAGNNGTFGGSGGNGGNVSAGSQIKCGGGGGGGGGKANTSFNQGGKGGAGGYPGGGGGGSGSSNAATQKSGGAGAAGVVWLFYR